ncbi:metal-dependent hydrolase [Amycolatopsis nigrescens]|uniref:metal-dependent hydrolase n=1 Tax=Amycolatopsis nigrescens TaxID=381445 RepID=UPI00058F360A|nr:metal-dependent hydrolase [Amycolatopsis nigrescens]
MPLPQTSTHVGYPAGAVDGDATVLAVLPRETAGEWLVITDRTPFHPLDSGWPDQPADTGQLVLGDRRLTVLDCLIGAAAEDSDELLVGEDIPVRRGEQGWRWLVLHVVESDADLTDLAGAPAGLQVDARRRRELSAGHTGCHLMALALNAVLAGRWRKEVRTDGLGAPDFDALAITSSRIHPGGSTDTYRIGKSLRKKGFSTDGLAGELPELSERVNGRLAGWLATDAPVELAAPGPELTARRTWSCLLPDGTPTIPCGGTHLRRLGELSALTVRLELAEDGSTLVANTIAELA